VTGTGDTARSSVMQCVLAVIQTILQLNKFRCYVQHTKDEPLQLMRTLYTFWHHMPWPTLTLVYAKCHGQQYNKQPALLITAKQQQYNYCLKFTVGTLISYYLYYK